MYKLTHFSLCSGIGGLDLAAEWAGFETIGQCEINEFASKVLEKNFPGVKNYHDVRTITSELLAGDGIKRGNITVLSAGFPCQPYSLAGKGLGDGDARDLWGEIARCIGELRPQWFVGENTPGLFSRENQKYFKRIVTDVSTLGYCVSWGIWGACDVGAPHQRERVFIVARNSYDVYDKAKRKFYAQNDDADRVRGKISDTNSLWELQSERSKQNFGQWTCYSDWWETEPDVGRVAHGISNRVDRLRRLGNAVVPQQAYPIFTAIAEYEHEQAAAGSGD